MKVLLVLTLVLCLTVVIGDSNSRRRSQRRRPPAEIPENLEQDKPETGKEKDTVHNEAPPVEQPSGEKKEPEVAKPTDAEEEENEKKKNQTTPLSQLFVPRATRRPRPLPQGSRRPRPTLPSFIRNSGRQSSRTSTQREDSSQAQKVTSAPTSSRAKATSPNSGRRRTTPAPNSGSAGSKRFGRSEPKAVRSNARGFS